MSTKTSTEPEDRHVEKDVTIRCYAEPGVYIDVREFGDDLEMTKKDYYATETVESVKGELKFGDEVIKTVYNEDDVKEYQDANIGDFVLEVERTTDTGHKWSEGYISTEVKKWLRDKVLDEFMPHGLERTSSIFSRWEGDEGRYVKLRSSGAGKGRVLAHRDRRSRDNRFESEKEVPYFDIRFEVVYANESEMEEFDERVLAPVMKRLSQIEQVNKVRLTECTKTVSEGDCM